MTSTLSLMPMASGDPLIEAVLEGSRGAVFALRPVTAGSKVTDALCEPLNAAAVDIFGGDEGAVTGRPLSALLTAEAWAELHGIVAAVVGESRSRRFACRLGPEDGAPVFSCVAMPTRDGRVLLIADDAGGRAADLRTAEQIHAAVLSTLRHDLRTPLNTIIGFAELMEGEHLGPIGMPQYRDYSHDIAAAGTEMLERMEHLFAHEHYESLARQGQADSRLVDLAPDLIAVLEGGVIDRINRAGAEMLGHWSADQLVGREFLTFVAPDDRGAIAAILKTAETGADVPSVHLQRPGGGARRVDLRASPVAERTGTGNRVLVVGRDVTERTRAQQAIASRELRLRTIMETALDGIFALDDRGVVQDANAAAERMFGAASGELDGTPLSALLARADTRRQARQTLARLRAFVRTTCTSTAEVMMRHRSGRAFPAEIGIAEAEVEGRTLFIGTIRDITERKENEIHLRDLATREPLTKLWNRAAMEERLDQMLDAEGGDGGPARCAVLFVDLDNFRSINEAWGLDFGDRTLVRVADRLQRLAGADETVAHMGGDEFVVLSSAATDAAAAVALADMIRARLAQPLTVDGKEVFISASVGVAIHPEHGATRAALWRNVHSAAAQAKQGGRNTTEVYSDTLSVAAARRMDVEAALRRAIERDSFDLHFQAKVDLRTRRIIGAEALVRWTSEQLGPIGPDEFIPLAERTGLIMPLGEWVIRKACEHGAGWAALGLPPIHVGVNLSAVQFAHGDLVGWIKRSVDETGLDAARLDLELTETMLASDVDDTIRTLARLKDLGARVSMDDFGTGYSSLSYLTRFPLDSLKVDRAFVTSVPDDPDAVTLARAIVGMGKSLRLDVVAEGVETEAQVAFLRDLGCDVGQGYLFSKPLPGDAFIDLLRAQSNHLNLNDADALRGALLQRRDADSANP
jgi:diguanylate cyclase (GGDEF)-like protein/PAS domain S-box-containing protein